ncbi:hypothetical protein [Microbacterium sp. 8M]|jgi:hypothetical protein|uniref:hypothetical protein n=1 Tax=Microbacterium sp. 8M TaxID=2653153 RepID=UPI00135A47B3|nr:hypothetical protein [Microbacterium sp. 8M]
MTDTKQVLQITVVAERLPDGHEAFGVEIASDPRMPAAWAAEFLHGVASSIADEGLSTGEEPNP